MNFVGHASLSPTYIWGGEIPVNLHDTGMTSHGAIKESNMNCTCAVLAL